MFKKTIIYVFSCLLLSATNLNAAINCKDFSGTFRGSLGKGALETFAVTIASGGSPFDIWFSFNDSSTGMMGCPSRFISCTQAGPDQINIVLGAENFLAFESHLEATMVDKNQLNVSSFQCIHNGVPYINLSGKGILSK